MSSDFKYFLSVLAFFCSDAVGFPFLSFDVYVVLPAMIGLFSLGYFYSSFFSRM